MAVRAVGEMLCGLLVQAQSKSEAEMKMATEAILELKNRDLSVFLQELLEVVRQGNVNNLQLAMVLLTSCLNANDQKVMDTQYYELVCQCAIQLMDHERGEIAHAAAMMFGTVASFLLRDNSHLGLVEWMCECLSAANSELFVHNLLKAIKEIMKATSIDSSSANILVSGCLQYLLNPMYCLDVLEIVSSMEDSFIDRTTAEIRSMFIQTLLELTLRPELKKASYDCWSLLILHCTSECKLVLGQVVEMAAHDIQAQSEASVLFAGLRFVETLFVKRLSSKLDFFDFRVFDALIEPVIAVIMSVTCEMPDEPDAWEPHIEAFSCIAIMCKSFPSHSCSVFMSLLPRFVGSSNPVMREISLFLAKLIIKYSDREIDFDCFLAFISDGVKDSSSRVRYRALVAADFLMRHIRDGDENGKKQFPELISSIKLCLTDHPLNASAAMDALRSISQLENYCESDLLLPFFELSTSSNEIVCASALNQIQEIIADLSNVEPFAEPVITLMRKSFEIRPLNVFQDCVIDILNSVIDKSGNSLLPYLEIIWRMLMASHEPIRLIPLGRLASSFGSDFLPYLPETAECILAAFNLCENETDVILSCSAIEALAISEICPMSDFANALLFKIRAPELSDKARSNIMETISLVFTTRDTELAPLFAAVIEVISQICEGIRSENMQPKASYFTGCFRFLNFIMAKSEEDQTKQQMATLALSFLELLSPKVIAKLDETGADVVLDVLLTLASEYFTMIATLYHEYPHIETILERAEEFENLQTPTQLFRKILHGECL